MVGSFFNVFYLFVEGFTESSTVFSSPMSIFMTTTLNSLSGILLISSSFSSLAVILSFFPPHLGDMPLSVFCLNIYGCFHVLGNLAMCLFLESCGLMKKRSCSAL